MSIPFSLHEKTKMKKILSCLLALLCCGLAFAFELPDPDFQVAIQEVKILTPVVRPGTPVVAEVTFKALQGRPSVEYRGFLHIEREKTNPICLTNLAIVDFGIDWWQQGGDTYHGIYSINVPPSTQDGERVLHVGFYIDVQNFMVEDTYTFTVDKNAPECTPTAPAPLAKNERGRRQALLSTYVSSPLAVLETLNYRFAVNAAGEWRLTDKANRLDWHSDPTSGRLGMAAFVLNGEKKILPVTGLTLKSADGTSMVLGYSAPEGLGDLEITIQKKASDDRALEFSWKQLGGNARFSDMIFPEHAFPATGEENAIALIPNAMGVLMYADENMPVSMSFLPCNSYGGLYMNMGGMVRANGGIMFYWDDVDTTLGARRQWNPPALPGSTSLDLTLVHPGEGHFTLVNVGTSDYAKVAGAYRSAAKEKGYLKTFKDKFGDGPNPIDGYMSFRPECMMHYVPNTRYNNTDKEIRYFFHSFDEIATTSEFLKNTLDVQKAIIIFAGWGKCGYDFHPEVLPANEDCGGDEGLRKASDRIRALGYHVGGHDNYQDLYPAAQGYSEDDIIRDADGSLHKGGVWAHGQCYIANTGAMLKNAKQNIPEIKKRYGFDYHLIDTVFAVPLIPDYNPACRASRYDDMRGKQRLCQYVRDQIGLVGSEEGIEWGVPVADYFDSLFGQRVNRRSTDVVVPLFEMVYGDCISIYQGNRTTVTMPDAVLDHILCAEMPCMIFPDYPGTDLGVKVLKVEPLNKKVVRVTYLPTSTGPAPEELKLILHLGEVGANIGIESAVSGGEITLQASEWNQEHTMDFELPGEGGDCRYELLAMVLKRVERQQITGLPEMSSQRYLVGTIVVQDGQATLEAPQPPRESCFARWDEKPEFNWTNCALIANMSHIVGDIMDRTRDYPMTAHRFLTDDRKVEQSEFGPVKITVNYGETPYDTGRFVLPRWGFAAEAPGFVAFRADAADGVVFQETTMLSRTPERTYFAYGDEAAK